MKQRLSTVLIVCAVALALCFFLEGYARIFLKHKIEVSEGSPWEDPGWGTKYLQKNREGFRDKNHPLKKPNHTLRIAVIGDSYTFGWRIRRPEDRYTSILEYLLNSKSAGRVSGTVKNYEVMNFSIPGISTPREMEIYDKHVKKYKPDIVILGVLPNDIFLNKEILENKNKPFFSAILKHSYMSRYLFLQYAKHIFKTRKWLARYLNNIHKAIQNPGARKVFENNIVQFRNKCEGDNTSFVVALFPIFLDFRNNPLEKERVEIMKIYDKNKIDVIDLFPYFKGMDVNQLKVNDYDPHPNEKAHEIIADAIFKELKYRGLATRYYWEHEIFPIMPGILCSTYTGERTLMTEALTNQPNFAQRHSFDWKYIYAPLKKYSKEGVPASESFPLLPKTHQRQPLRQKPNYI